MGDRLLVRHGEVVPVDGTLSRPADLDESTLTREPPTRHRLTADAICSGVLDAGAVFEVIASVSAKKSTPAGVVWLASATQSERSPSARLADRYAFVFGGVAVLPAGASWILTGDSTCCLAVLVVAIPCPLILAVPVAITLGPSRCAKRGVLVKGGGALGRSALADTLSFDRTGTPTSGFVRLVDAECTPHYASDIVLGLAGSIVQASNHVTVEVVAKATREQDAKLRPPSGAIESLGAGVCDRIDGYVVSIGSLPYVPGPSAEPSRVEAFAKRMSYAGVSVVFVGASDELVGALQLVGHVHLEAPRALWLLRREGTKWQTMLTGDRADVAESVESMLGVVEVHTALSPTAKLVVIRSARADGEVTMVGNDVNDAPAPTVAGIGVAMDARGIAASSEAVDIVLLVDRLNRLVDAVRITHRTYSVALQSVMIGISLLLAAIVVAVLGHLPPLAGAMLQELIDVLAIVSVSRALLPTSDEATRSFVYADVEHLKAEYVELELTLSRIRPVADTLPHMGSGAAEGALLSLDQSLTDVLVPHERRDDIQLYPNVARLFGGDDPMAAMSVMHREIFHVTNLLGRIVADVSADGPDVAVAQELQRLLYRLGATLRLRCAQEDELFHVLGGEA